MADNNGTPLPAGAPYNRGEQLKMWLGGEAELPPGAPYNRDEQLVMWLGDEAELPPGAPYNRDEQLTMWLKDHIGGGGGNPNREETINGTLAAPWGSVDPAALHQSVLAGDASASLDIDATALGFGHVQIQMDPFRSTYIDFSWIASAGLTPSQWTALVVEYGLNGVFELAYLLQSETVTDMTQYAQMLSTVLTVIHHPLPDTP